MRKVYNLMEKRPLSLYCQKNMEKYFGVLENNSVVVGDKKDLCTLMRLLGPFFEELDNKFGSNRILIGEGRGSSSYPISKFTSRKSHDCLEGMGLISDQSLTQEGYDVITFYKREKGMPSREEIEEQINKEICGQARNLGW